MQRRKIDKVQLDNRAEFAALASAMAAPSVK
jgi:hypothetical protein